MRAIEEIFAESCAVFEAAQTALERGDTDEFRRLAARHREVTAEYLLARGRDAGTIH